MLRKVALGLVLINLATFTFAGEDLCENLNGTWMGVYRDPSNLFTPGNFPISFKLKYQNNKVYGYTLPAPDNKAGNFGSKTGAYFFIANCTHNTLSQVYFLRNAAAICGDPSSKKLQLSSTNSLVNLILPYENAMIGANLSANLIKQAQASTMDPTLFKQVQDVGNARIETCH